MLRCYSMKRIAQQYLNTWIKKKHRLPLIIRGARQVGKSTLVKIFCEDQGINLIEVNLERMRLSSVDKASYQIQSILDEVQLKTKKTLNKSSLLFFDEIQESPELLKALRYFYEERPDIPIVCAGSLLEVVLNNEKFSFPVGRVEFYHLGPMNFTEFLWATDNHFLAENLERLNFTPELHDVAIDLLKKYYFIGGMPKAVLTYATDNSLLSVRDVQEQIIQTYLADFPKYNPRIRSERIDKVFYSTVNHLGKKVIYQHIDSHSKSRETRRVIELLIDAKVLLSCTHSESNSVPLKGEEDNSIQKLYFLDIGLLNSITRIDFEMIEQIFEENFNTKGVIAEQFVAQHLAYSNPSSPPQLFYWLRDKGINKGEVDFIIENKNSVIPVEVKSAKPGHLKSLHYFSKEKSKGLAVKLSLQPYNAQTYDYKIIDGHGSLTLIELPLYAVEQIYKTLSNGK